MNELGQHRRCTFGAPTGKAGEAVGRVADQAEVVGDRRRWHAPLGAHPGVIVGEVATPVPQHDPVVADELGHVLVGRAHEDALDPLVGVEPDGRSQDTTPIIRGIEYAVEKRVDVINMSLTADPSEALKRAVKKAADAGIVSM